MFVLAIDAFVFVSLRCFIMIIIPLANIKLLTVMTNAYVFVF